MKRTNYLYAIVKNITTKKQKVLLLKKGIKATSHNIIRNIKK